MPVTIEQQAAISIRNGAFNITAVPGSGKTTVFAARARAILNEGCTPCQFLGMTFTKSAALEFEARSKYVSGPGKPKIFRTFHGWALDFVTRNRENFPFEVSHWPLLTEQFKILVPLIRQAPRRLKYRDVQGAISGFKRHNMSPEEAYDHAEGEFGEIYAGIYERYEAACQRIGKLDFDSMLIETVNLLDDRSDILEREQIKYLQCDEAQDNDELQWKLVQLLSMEHGNVFCVGDPNQNMYSWRGSDPEGLTTKFLLRFPNAKQLFLSENFRSTGAIVEYLNRIAPVKVDMRTRNPYGVKPSFRRFYGDVTEAEAVLTEMGSHEETVILARTNRQLAAFERLCGEKEIKYKLLGRSGFFHQEEVNATIAFAQYFINPTDHVVKTIIKSPFDCSRHLKKGEVIDALEAMQKGSVGRVPFAKLLSSFRMPDHEQTKKVLDLNYRLQETAHLIRGKQAQDSLRNIITAFGILHHYEDDEDAVDNSPADNIRTLLRMAENKSSLMDFVYSCLKAKAATRSNSKDRLTLSTCHSAKGKEWDHVYVVGVNDEVLPHINGDPEEEARVYFVACSRAAKTLHVSCNSAPSPYIRGDVVAAEVSDPDFLHVMVANAQRPLRTS